MSPVVPSVNPWMIVPFGLLLLAMALGPALFPNWWAKHYFKVAVGLGLVTLCYYLVGLKAYERVLGTAHEYVSFIVLIGSLFVVSGGIHLTVKGEATPATNVLFLFLGAVVANVLGTTGASMLLVRPWIRMNKYRITGHHLVFFIFIVSNVGGCLTPVGDPPLFLGYLHGVPFWWVALRCWPMWCVAVGVLLALFYVQDVRNYRRAPAEVRAGQTGEEHWRFEGLWNLLWLGVILGAIFIEHPLFLREGLMAGAALASYFTTPAEVHQSNHFTWHPFQEVAGLFIGIFSTMLPALDWLELHAANLAHPSPTLFYWATGSLSSVLDNAPTYLSFLSALQGLSATAPDSGHGLELPSVAGLIGSARFDHCLVALSVGAVFFGALTYIGNGPNFMVKSIAEHQKVRAPGFLRYIWAYSLPYLGPTLALVWLLFFRHARL